MFRRKHDAEAEDPLVIADVVQAQTELEAYFKIKFSAVQAHQAKVMLATEWWSFNSHKYPLLGYCAIRLHSAAVVSSSLERFFSAANLVTGLRRQSLSIENQHLFTAAYLAGNAGIPLKSSEAQDTILWYVNKCQTISATKNIADIDDDKFDEVTVWLQKFAHTGGGGLLYVQPKSENNVDVSGEGSDNDEEEDAPVEPSEIVVEMDSIHEAHGRRASSRTRKAPVRLDL